MVYYPNSYSSEDKVTSQFNEAAFQLSRLHNIWLNCKTMRENGNFLGWKWILDSAMIELWNDALRLDNDSDEEEKDKQIDKTKTFKGRLELIDDEIFDAEKKKDLPDLYSKLKQKEMLLREIQEAAGKGTKLKLVDDDDM